MIIYTYNGNSGEFISAENARPSPLDMGAFIKGGGTPEEAEGITRLWLVPANATLVSPPDCPPGFSRVFKNGSWDIVEDNRGKTYYLSDGSDVTLSDLGPVPEGYLASKPEPTTEDKIRDVRQIRNSKLAEMDWVVTRHMTERVKTLTDTEYSLALDYMQALRDFPANVNLDNIIWPPKPAFMN